VLERLRLVRDSPTLDGTRPPAGVGGADRPLDVGTSPHPPTRGLLLFIQPIRGVACQPVTRVWRARPRVSLPTASSAGIAGDHAGAALTEGVGWRVVGVVWVESRALDTSISRVGPPYTLAFTRTAAAPSSTGWKRLAGARTPPSVLLR